MARRENILSKTPSGYIREENYLHDHIISKFIDICSHINSEFDLDLTCRDLAILSMNLQNFMVDSIGPNRSTKQSLMTKIPATCFRDMSINGSLYFILKACFKYKQQMRWNEFTFEQKSKYEDNIGLLLLIEEDLLNANKMKIYKIFFSPDISSDTVTELALIVERHHGEVVTSEKEAEIVVVYDPSVDHEEQDHSFQGFRIIEMSVNGDYALAHWRYFPDSYDQWIPQHMLEEGQPIDISEYKQYKKRVSPRFLKDLEFFNEWMNPLDYIVSTEDRKLEKKQQKKHKKHKKKKRKRTGDVDSAEELMEKAVNLFEAKPTENIESLPYSNIVSGGGPAGIGIKQDISSSSHQSPFIIPSCSRWFNMDDISPLERRMLPEFFNFKTVSKTPQIYMQYRNYMINLYRQDPSVPLLATSCRRSLAGDACAILRVHEFLDNWGLINFQVGMSAQDIEAAANAQESSENSSDSGYAFTCAHCHKKSLGVRYTYKSKKLHKLFQDKAIICTDCVENRNLPLSLKVENLEKVNDPCNWNQEELTNLIQTVLQSNHDSCDLEEISASLGSKSKDECISKLMECDVRSAAAVNQDSHPSDSVLQQWIADLIGLVHPDVAKQAAKAAIGTILEKNGGESQQDFNYNMKEATTLVSQSCADSGYFPSGTPDHETIERAIGAQVAAATALGAMAAKGNEIVSKMEKEIESLMNSLLSSKVKRIELKLLEMDALEKGLLAERDHLARIRHDFYLERLKFATNVKDSC